MPSTIAVNPAHCYSASMSGDGSSLGDLATFLNRLVETKIHATVTTNRERAIMVIVAVPGERWEVEFFHDRKPEIEVFRSDGSIGGEEMIDRLFREFGD